MLRRLGPWLALAARFAVGGVFVVSGAIKLPDPAQTVAAVRAYEALPAFLVAPVGQLLPIVEIVVGLMLILGLLTRTAAAIASVLLVVFIIGVISVWVRGIDIDCGCFGGGGYDPDATSQYPWEIARDTALLAGSLFLLFVRSHRFALDTTLFAPRPQET